MIAWFIGQLVIGWLTADFVGGVFHWWEDRCATLDMPIIGPWLVAPNRLHHAEPLAFLSASFLDRNLALIVGATIVGIAWTALFGWSPALGAAMVGGALANEIHTWSHSPSSAPRWVRIAQEIGLLKSPKHHAGHHRPPQDRRYCPVTDWLNPALDAVRLWERLETGLTRIGLEPNRGTR